MFNILVMVWYGMAAMECLCIPWHRRTKALLAALVRVTFAIKKSKKAKNFEKNLYTRTNEGMKFKLRVLLGSSELLSQFELIMLLTSPLFLKLEILPSIQ